MEVCRIQAFELPQVRIPFLTGGEGVFSLRVLIPAGMCQAGLVPKTGPPTLSSHVSSCLGRDKPTLRGAFM